MNMNSHKTERPALAGADARRVQCTLAKEKVAAGHSPMISRAVDGQKTPKYTLDK